MVITFVELRQDAAFMQLSVVAATTQRSPYELEPRPFSAE